MKAFFSRLTMFLTHGAGWRVLLGEVLIFVLIACAVFGVALGVNLAFVGSNFSDREAMRDQ